MNYNTLRNKPTINYRELIGDSTVSEVGGITEEEFNTLMSTDLASYYTKAQIDELFSRSYVYREKSGSIVTFDCPSTSQTIPEVTVGIEAVQSGTGDPSPTNVRPISGWTEANVVVSPTTDAEDGTTYNIQFKDGDNPLTVYGGTLDVVSGVLTVDRALIKLSDLIWTKQNTINNNWRFKSNQSIQNIKIPTNAAYKIDNLCSVYRNVTANETWTGDDTGIAINADASLLICDLNQADTTALGVVIANQTICYELATPLTIQLTPTPVKSLLGTNNLWADTGDIEVKCLDRIIPAEE